jgi:hypothetical protein
MQKGYPGILGANVRDELRHSRKKNRDVYDFMLSDRDFAILSFQNFRVFKLSFVLVSILDCFFQLI